MARSSSLDVVFIDAKDSAGEPYSLAKEIRAASSWRKPMFVAIAGPGNAHCESCCREAGIDLLLFEPMRPEQLSQFLGRMRAVLAEYEAFDPCI